MKSSVTRSFRRRFQRLPREVQRQAVEAFLLWKADRSHPGLHFKQVHSRKPVYSARVGQHFRVLGFKQGDHMHWYWIGSHSEYDKLLNQL